MAKKIWAVVCRFHFYNLDLVYPYGQWSFSLKDLLAQWVQVYSLATLRLVEVETVLLRHLDVIL